MKIKVAVLYGGVSGEHEVSLRSAASVIAHLDRSRFEIIPVGVSKRGDWCTYPLDALITDETGALSLSSPGASPCVFSSFSTANALCDVIFPVTHGALGEDGCLQGFLELLRLPYVGSGVLGSAIAMDKSIAKQLVAAQGISVAPSQLIHHRDWRRDSQAVLSALQESTALPCFVKPAASGSSLGISKVTASSEWQASLEEAFKHGSKVLVEQAIVGREIEVSVLETLDINEPILASVPGEIVPRHAFYDYAAKYQNSDGAELCAPAVLDEAQVRSLQASAIRVFDTLSLSGLARIDFFLEQGSGRLYFNEANTLPGFTSISMYPRLWQASGLGYTELLTRLIELAVSRHS